MKNQAQVKYAVLKADAKCSLMICSETTNLWIVKTKAAHSEGFLLVIVV